MFIVRVLGGLGNQMFQYAFHKGLQSYGHKVKLDLREYGKFSPHNGFELDRVFDVNYCECSEEEREQLSDCRRNLLHRIRRKLFGMKKTAYYEKNANFDYRCFNLSGDKYFSGFWQSEKYFAHISEQIRQDFTFKLPLGIKSINLMERILHKNSVSLHVRRGDYVGQKFFEVCSESYFTKAISYVSGIIENPVFFVFSDDINWCRQKMGNRSFYFIDWNKGASSYEDLHLMSLCKNNIIANSTFSWWGAWLNRNPDKIVIAPNKWYNDNALDFSDVVPSRWVKL